MDYRGAMDHKETMDHRGAMDHKGAVVLSSGGVDSTTTMAIAREQGFEIYSLSFDYGQKNRYELECTRKVAAFFQAREHLILSLNLRQIGGSALTSEIAVPRDRTDEELLSGIPVTYVPARNLIFLSIAVAWAESRNMKDIFIGVNAIDYSGYPDCRPDFIKSFQQTANLGTRMGMEAREVEAREVEAKGVEARGLEAKGGPIEIHTPLINLGKKEIISRGLSLGVDYGLTSSCYDPDPTSGRPCGRCDSCRIRRKGFAAIGQTDPLEYLTE